MPWQALLQRTERLPTAPLAQWYGLLLAELAQPLPLHIALLGGRMASTPGLAFLAGYQAALRALWPAAPSGLGALCVTEKRSTRPADLTTRLQAQQLTGVKDFVTAASAAEWLMVAARCEAEGAPRIAATLVYSDAPGVQVQGLPALPIMPDISHGRLLLEQSPCERLPGDGWDAYFKPFRSLEDLYVLASVSAWLYGVGHEQQWPADLRLSLLALLASCAELTRHVPNSASLHLLLAGCFAQFKAMRAEIDQAMTGHFAELWQRDANVLEIARNARAQRLAKAWQSFELGPF